MKILEWLRSFFKRRSYKKIGKQVKSSALKREMLRRVLEDEIRSFIFKKRKQGKLTAFQALQLANKRFKGELKLGRMSLTLSGKKFKVRSRVA